MSQRRRPTKAQTRLEMLEGRITPTVTSLGHVVGAQILVYNPDSGLSQTDMTKNELHAYKQYEHLLHINAKKAELFLGHHQKLAALLEQSARPVGNGTGTTISGQSNGTGNTTPTGSSTTPTQGGTSQTTSSSSTDSGTSNPTGTQGSGDTTVKGPVKPATGGLPTVYPAPPQHTDNTSSTPAGLEPVLWQLYQDYEAHGIDQAISDYSREVQFYGDNVGILIDGNAGNFNELVSTVTGLDSRINLDNPANLSYPDIYADVPVADLLTLAQDVNSLGSSVLYQSAAKLSL
jgi:hypothetical protein